jgi:hypothetical protein
MFDEQIRDLDSRIKDLEGYRRNPRRHTRANYNERKFWESCVLACLCQEDNVEKAVQKADSAELEWKARWNRPEGDDDE